MTISDIAKMAGVSSAAVSRYLNGGPLSEQKREAIREVVEKTGYRPDAAAQTLRTGRVNQIGVIAPSISSQSVGQITAGIASELDQQNYLILLGNTELDEQRELGYLTAMQRNHVAGIILLGCYYSPQLARAFKACRVPLVVTGQRFPEVPCVYNDDRSAARELAQRMLACGHRRLAYIGGTEKDQAVGLARRQGVQDALNAAGLDGDKLPLTGEGYAYPDSFDIIARESKQVVRIINGIYAEVLPLAQYQVDGVPLVDARGNAIAVSTQDGLQEYLTAVAQDKAKLNELLHFETFRKIVFRSGEQEDYVI